jgi:hypothetical protein
MADWRAVKNALIAGGDPLPAVADTITGKRLNAYGALMCSQSTVLARLTPQGTTLMGSTDTPMALAALHTNCAQPNGEVSVRVDPGGELVTLREEAAISS